MPKEWNHTEAFAHFGVTPRNVQWSWSGRTGDGKTVVVTLWQDQFEIQNGRFVYERPPSPPDEPDTRLGFLELMENLAWARDHCDGRFKVIAAVARDKTARPRSMKECTPTKMVMRLTHLDLDAGSFAAEEEGL